MNLQPNIKNLTFLLLIYIALTPTLSCNKFLEKKANSKLITPQTLEDLQAMLDDDESINNRTPELGETSSDDYFLIPTTANTLSEERKGFYTWAATEYSDGDWGTTTKAIYIANLTLELLTDVTETIENRSQWNNVKGSALFLRSYYWLSLLCDYGKAYDSSTAAKDLGIMLRTASDFNKIFQRSTVLDSYSKIINDTKLALPLLPKIPEVASRPSKWAAYGLLARTYLTKRDYKNAFKYSDSALSINSTLINYNEIAEDKLLSQMPFSALNAETIFYSTYPQFTGLFYYFYPGYVDTLLYESYESNDLRKSAYFTTDQTGYHIFKGSYSDDGFKNVFTGIATDEMYLIRSECNIREGRLKEGLDDLNTLLSKRYKMNKLGVVSYENTEAALNRVILERRKELLFRGLRWVDIKRLNKENRSITLKRLIDGKTQTLNPNSGYYALPFPSDLIRITGITQN